MPQAASCGPRVQGQLGMASFVLGASVSYLVVQTDTTRVIKDGVFVAVSGTEGIVFAPHLSGSGAAPFEVPSSIPDTPSVCGIFESVELSYLRLTSDVPNIAGVNRVALSSHPDLKVLGRKYFADENRVSSDGVAGAAWGAPPPPAQASSQTAWSGLSSAAPLWGMASGGRWLKQQHPDRPAAPAPATDSSESDMDVFTGPTAGAASRYPMTGAGSAIFGGPSRSADRTKSAVAAGSDEAFASMLGSLFPASSLGPLPGPLAASSSPAPSAPVGAAGRAPGQRPLTGVGTAPTTVPGPTADTVNQVTQMQMLKMLHDMQKRQAERAGNADSGGDDAENDGHDRKLGREFRGIRKARDRFARHPQKVTQAYVDRLRRELGVTHPSQYWQCKDHSRKVRPSFGRMTGLWRVHHAVAECLQLHLDGHDLHVGAYLALLSQAILQAAVDGGDWQNAAWLLPTEDPLARTTWGGDEQALSEIFSYRKALRELRGRQVRKEGGEEDEEPKEAAVDADAKKKGRRGGGRKTNAEK